MGTEYRATCKACGHEFRALDGGGINFELVRCRECGRVRSIDRAALPQSAYGPGDHGEIERAAGRCGCGGRYAFDAPIRCPRCRSPRVRLGDELKLYD